MEARIRKSNSFQVTKGSKIRRSEKNGNTSQFSVINESGNNVVKNPPKTEFGNQVLLFPTYCPKRYNSGLSLFCKNSSI